MANRSISLDWSVIEGLLPQGWRELAVEMKLIKPNLPKHLNAKVTDIAEVLRLIFFRSASNCGLQTVAAAFAAGGLLDISHVGLHYWEKNLGPYLSTLLGQLVGSSLDEFAPERWAGYEIILTDATCVQRPGSTETTERIHRALRLPDLRVVGFKITDVKGGETFRNFDPEQGQIWIGDRGYPNPPGIAWVKAAKAEVLVRYNRGSLPLYDAQGQPIDVLSKVGKLRKAGSYRQWQAFVHPAGGARIAGRLCAFRLPTKKADEARQRLRREQGADLTEQSLAMADFVVVFTTVPASALSCIQVLELYRLRWQIELDFKRDKSTTGLDELPNKLPCTIETWIYAKLILHQLLRKLADSGSAIPPSALAESIGPAQGCIARDVRDSTVARGQDPMESIDQNAAADRPVARSPVPRRVRRASGQAPCHDEAEADRSNARRVGCRR